MNDQSAQLLGVTPVLYTKDLAATLDFYCRLLGFKVVSGAHDEPWAFLSRDGIDLMVSLPPASVAFAVPTFTGSFYFKTKQIDALWDTLRDKVQVCYPPEDFGYGIREFAVYDVNGYLLQFGETIA